MKNHFPIDRMKVQKRYDFALIGKKIIVPLKYFSSKTFLHAHRYMKIPAIMTQIMLTIIAKEALKVFELSNSR